MAPRAGENQGSFKPEAVTRPTLTQENPLRSWRAGFVDNADATIARGPTRATNPVIRNLSLGERGTSPIPDISTQIVREHRDQQQYGIPAPDWPVRRRGEVNTDMPNATPINITIDRSQETATVEQRAPRTDVVPAVRTGNQAEARGQGRAKATTPDNATNININIGGGTGEAGQVQVTQENKTQKPTTKNEQSIADFQSKIDAGHTLTENENKQYQTALENQKQAQLLQEKMRAGKATPEDLVKLKELSGGSVENTDLTPEQQMQLRVEEFLKEMKKKKGNLSIDDWKELAKIRGDNVGLYLETLTEEARMSVVDKLATIKLPDKVEPTGKDAEVLRFLDQLSAITKSEAEYTQIVTQLRQSVRAQRITKRQAASDLQTANKTNDRDTITAATFKYEQEVTAFVVLRAQLKDTRKQFGNTSSERAILFAKIENRTGDAGFWLTLGRIVRANLDAYFNSVEAEIQAEMD